MSSSQSGKRSALGPMLAAAGAATTAGILAYARLIRPWHLRWGATAEEVARAMPGDDWVAHPALVATRAVTISATAEEIWPWLVQMGYRRAGWYSYDRFDNDGVHVTRIVPAWQSLKVGDVMLTGPEGGFRVEAIEPRRSLLLRIDRASIGMNADIVLGVALEPRDEQHTRLIFRLHAAFRGWLERLWGSLLFDFGDFVMMRKQLLGIKARVERHAAGAL